MNGEYDKCISYIESKGISPDRSNEIRFHGTMEEFKKYLPELYEKMMKENDKSFEPSRQCCEGTENLNNEENSSFGFTDWYRPSS